MPALDQAASEQHHSLLCAQPAVAFAGDLLFAGTDVIGQLRAARGVGCHPGHVCPLRLARVGGAAGEQQGGGPQWQQCAK